MPSEYTQGYEEGKRKKRNELIRKMHSRNYTQQEIAEIVHVSRQRVNQIVNSTD